MLMMPCSALSVSISASMPNGQPDITIGHEFEGCDALQINTMLDPSDGFLSEAGTCQGGICGSWISDLMMWSDGYMDFEQGFVARDRVTSWHYAATPGGVATWIDSQPEK